MAEFTSLRVQVLNSDSNTVQDKSSAKTEPSIAGSGGNRTCGSNSGNTSSHLKPPPAFPRSSHSKKLELPTTTTTDSTETPKADLPPAARTAIASTTVINAITSTTAASTNPVNINLTHAQDPINIQHSYKDTDHRMEIIDDSEDTSDSDKDDAMEVDARSSDISAESSFICEDLTDSGDDSDSN
ncbi:hypothetical protein BG015_008098 [Linnemannia schmuckeri]|uniref:Uncharacterized protein n=1 Tax=Linnemannia schmuckeri TaxID=64567 RepID=A0A9P5S0X7_9FUNG|nr:hypothetical protein BG015_008098 [Linnemannia schmuckeri]